MRSLTLYTSLTWAIVVLALLNLLNLIVLGMGVDLYLLYLPVRYLMMFLVAMVIVSQFTRSDYNKLLFWLGLMPPWSIFLVFTILHLNGLVACPASPDGLPLCVQFFVGFSLIILFNRLKKNLRPDR